jgi:sugar lactone lactonase YvrE
MKSRFGLMAGAVATLLAGCGGSKAPEAEAPSAAPTAAAAVDLPASITINTPGLSPEGIEYDTKNNRFLVGSITQGTVFVVANDGTLTPFIQDPDLKSSVGIEVDEERNRLLVANSDAAAFGGQVPGQAKLGVYDLDSGMRIAMVDLGALGPEGAKAHFANDMTVGKDGSVYVTDSLARVVFKVDPTYTPSVFLPNGFANKKEHVLNGIVYHPSGYLLVGESVEGKLFAVSETDANDISEVTLAEPVKGVDGLVWGTNGDLLVVRNDDSTRVVALRTEDDWKSAGVAGTGVFTGQATTGAVAGDAVFVVHPMMGDATVAPSIERVEIK